MPARRPKTTKRSAKAAPKRRAPKAAKKAKPSKAKSPAKTMKGPAKSARPARPAAAKGPVRAACHAKDPFGDPCQSSPRPGSQYCTIHSYLER